MPLVVVIAFALFGGLSLWYWGPPNASIRSSPLWIPPAPEELEAIPEEELNELARRALDYADAMRNGQCEEVARMTLWIQERLRHLGTNTPDTDFCEEIRRRTPQGNQITDGGIEDQYLFVPGVEIVPIAVDTGRTDLARPVAQRTWLRVRYPMKSQALRDGTGVPIHSLRVGVNMTADGYVLKAGVLGNLDIEWDAFNYSW